MECCVHNFLFLYMPCLEWPAIPCDVLMKHSHMSARYQEDIHEALNCQIILEPGQSDGAIFTVSFLYLHLFCSWYQIRAICSAFILSMPYLHLFCSWYRNTCYLFAFISQCLVACYNTLKLYRSLRGMEEGEWCKWKPFLESPLEQQSPADLPLFWFLVSPFKWVWVVR